MEANKSYKISAFSGARWTTASSVTITLTRFLQIAILARFLSPVDFGLVGMVTIAIGFSQAFSDAGVSAAIVQRPQLMPEQLSSLYWLNIFSGVVVFLAFLAITPVAVLFFGQEDLRNLFYLASLLFLIIPFGQQFQFLLQKELKFGTLARIDITAAVIATVISIAIAIFGGGAASLIIGQLSNAFIRAILLFASGVKLHKPKFRFKISDIRGFISFGLYQMGERCLNFFHSNVDYLLIGKILGPRELGYYTIAYNLIVSFIYKINPIINRVVFPLYSKMQDDTVRLKRGFLLTIKYLSLINFPILVGMAVVASPFVSTVYGPEWAPCVPIIRILTLVGILKSSINPIGSLLLSKNRADLGFKWNLIIAGCNTLAVYLVVGRGIVAVATTLAFLSLVYFVMGYNFLTKPLIGKCAKDVYINNFLVPMSYSLVMGALVYILLWIMPFSDLVLLITGVLVGVGVYLSVIILLEKETVSEFKTLFFGRRSP